MEHSSTNRKERLATQTPQYQGQGNTYRTQPGTNDQEEVVQIGSWAYLRREYIWDRCPLDEKCPWFLHDKPLTLLVVVIAINWLVCFIFAQIFIELEGPAQKVRT